MCSVRMLSALSGLALIAAVSYTEQLCIDIAPLGHSAFNHTKDAQTASNHGCGWYLANPESCNNSDAPSQSHFNASLQCCACGGGHKTSLCKDTDSSPGMYGITCKEFRNFPSQCGGNGPGKYEWSNDTQGACFNESRECCACGGGSLYTVPSDRCEDHPVCVLQNLTRTCDQSHHCRSPFCHAHPACATLFPRPGSMCCPSDTFGRFMECCMQPFGPIALADAQVELLANSLHELAGKQVFHQARTQRTVHETAGWGSAISIVGVAFVIGVRRRQGRAPTPLVSPLLS